MSRRLTNKQLAVLAVLREHGELSAKAIARKISEQLVCPECGGSGEGDSRRRAWDAIVEGPCCAKCGGRGHLYFDYATAYQALQRLRREGLVGRRCKRDDFGDEIPNHVYFAEAEPDASDPLEQAFRLPAAQEHTA